MNSVTNQYRISAWMIFPLSIAITIPITIATQSFADDTVIRVLRNSVGLSEFIDIDNDGNVFGRKDVLAEPGVILPKLFSFVDGVESTIKTPKTFTAVEAFRLSETKVLVGYAARPIGDPMGNMQACVWDLITKQVEMLPLPDAYRSSCGFDISADGDRVSGYVVGRNPPSMKPCVWERSDEEWKPNILSTLVPNNEFLLGGKVVINDAGTMVAACLAVKNDGRAENQLFSWAKRKNVWQRTLVSKTPFRLANINDHGDIAGTIRVGNHQRGCVLEVGKEMKTCDPLPGDVSTHLIDINNQGVAVGFSDDPPGPTGGPRGIIVKDGIVRELKIEDHTGFNSLSSICDNNLASGYALMPPTDPSDIESAAAVVVKLE